MTEDERDDFLLRADEAAEIFVDTSFDIIRRVEGLTGPMPDPVPISARNLRNLLRGAFKAGASFAFAEVADRTRAMK